MKWREQAGGRRRLRSNLESISAAEHAQIQWLLAGGSPRRLTTHCNAATHCSTLRTGSPCLALLHPPPSVSPPLLDRNTANSTRRTGASGIEISQVGGGEVSVYIEGGAGAGTPPTLLPLEISRSGVEVATPFKKFKPTGGLWRDTPLKKTPPQTTPHDTITRCSTLQHTATHCNTLQRIATQKTPSQTTPHDTITHKPTAHKTRLHHNTSSTSAAPTVGVWQDILQRTAPHNTLQHTAALQHTATHYNTLVQPTTGEGRDATLSPAGQGGGEGGVRGEGGDAGGILSRVSEGLEKSHDDFVGEGLEENHGELLRRESRRARG